MRKGTGAQGEGKKAVAFGRALRQIPMILVDNTGHNSADLVAKVLPVKVGCLSFLLTSSLNALFFARYGHGTIGSMKQLGSF